MLFFIPKIRIIKHDWSYRCFKKFLIEPNRFLWPYNFLKYLCIEPTICYFIYNVTLYIPSLWKVDLRQHNDFFGLLIVPISFFLVLPNLHSMYWVLTCLLIFSYSSVFNQTSKLKLTTFQFHQLKHYHMRMACAMRPCSRYLYLVHQWLRQICRN